MTDEADAILASEVGHGHGRVLVDCSNLGHGVHAAVARCHPELARTRRLGKLYEKRMLAPARTQEKNIDLRLAHVSSLVSRNGMTRPGSPGASAHQLVPVAVDGLLAIRPHRDDGDAHASQLLEEVDVVLGLARSW